MSAESVDPEEHPGAKGSCTEDELTGSIIGAFYKVYNTLGFGFLEGVYSAALRLELERKGHLVEREIRVRVYYEGTPLSWHRVDMLVDRRVVVEIKSTERLASGVERQLLNYLRATSLEVGLILHFGPKPSVRRLESRHK
jgi:GxxExxY protein